MICSKCKIDKPNIQFAHRNNKRVGLKCRECRNKQSKEYTSTNKEKRKESTKKYRDKKYLHFKAALLYLKFAKRCQDCKEYCYPEQLEFDHVPERGKKLFGIASGRDKSDNQLYDELQKCDLVCGNCHAQRTFQRNTNSKQSLAKKQIYLKRIKSIYNQCNQCKNKYQWYQLQFNHIDPKQKGFQISRCQNKSFQDLKNEIRKCEIICINCHALITHKQRTLREPNENY